MNASQTIVVGTTRLADASSPVTGHATSHAARLLECVWRQHAPRLAALAVGLGLNREQAGDALQDVFLTALRGMPEVATEADVVRWLFRVTTNRCHLEHRRRGRWRRLWQSVAGAWHGDGAAGTVPIVELRREVDAALARLAESDRLLVVLRYFVELNSRQIAEIVEQPESTVRSRLRIARLQLAEWLADWNEE
jgi:RNA polymerase sigma-70 factor (ECF subfamily)